MSNARLALERARQFRRDPAAMEAARLRPNSRAVNAAIERARVECRARRQRLGALQRRPAWQGTRALPDAGAVQMRDPVFLEEPKTWLRYSSQDAGRTGDRLYGASSGNPSLSSWLGVALFRLFLTPGSGNDKQARQVHGSADIAVFAGDGAGKARWVEVGLCCERFVLRDAPRRPSLAST